MWTLLSVINERQNNKGYQIYLVTWIYLYKPAFRKNVGFSEFSTVRWCSIKIDMKALAAYYQPHFHKKGDFGKLADHSTEAVTNGCVDTEPSLLLPVSQQICGDLQWGGTTCEFQLSFQVACFHAEFIQSTFAGVILYGIPSRPLPIF